MTFRHEELVNEIRNLRRFACKLCRNQSDAEDLLQSTVLKALENREKFESGTKLFSWASKIMFNIFASQYRRRVKFETQYDCEDLIKSQSVEAEQEKVVEMHSVGAALQLLSEQHRSVLMMVTVHGLPYEEVARIQNIPVGTVRSRLSRAREQLRMLLEAPRTEVTPFPVYATPAYEGQLKGAVM